ncbi:dimethylargininase [Nocardioides bruguierae]|uniref:N(G),N(G)-dimethylarginine dimethylaminohydrolase n=1 Tax=Nocardioides bruguierae TaxID=2945102 RepID=A0A9X2D5L5_9ACTN|nr:dimethylargininase [Nocardioides bruguierae]MCM0619623.1 N(G),N(G)-dimethylarginine dimethylaminohydrolase [Nocardioides bruguierae]
MPKLALVRRPGPLLADGIVTRRARTDIDLDLARAQWDGYVAALRGHGWRTVEVAPADACPDAVFVEDTAVVHGDTAIICRPGNLARRPETSGTEATLRDLGYRIARIEGPDALEGGDVLAAGGRLWVGLTTRTSHGALEQMRRHLADEGADLVGVPLSKVLHLKSTLTALPDGTFLGWEAGIDDPASWPGLVAAPEAEGACVVCLGTDTVLLSAAASRTRALLEGRGLAVVSVDISELEKLEGCVTCLSVRIG